MTRVSRTRNEYTNYLITSKLLYSERDANVLYDGSVSSDEYLELQDNTDITFQDGTKVLLQ